MTKSLKQITLRHLLLDGNKFIGIQFYPNKALVILAKGLSDASWSDEHDMFMVPNNPANLNSIFNLFRGFAWVNCKYFFSRQACF